MVSINITGYVEDKYKFEVKRSDLNVATKLIIGNDYVVYPQNIRKKHSGRFVTILSFVTDEHRPYIVIRYQDNNRQGRAKFEDLVTRSVYDELQAQVSIEGLKIDTCDYKSMEENSRKEKLALFKKCEKASDILE